MTIAELQILCLKYNVPFYCYKDPNEKKVRMGVQTSSATVAELDELSLNFFKKSKGFLLHPFNLSQHKALFINGDIEVEEKVPDTLAKIIQNCKFPEKECEPFLLENESKNEYLNSVEKIINDIKNGEYEKIVYSRTISAELDSDLEDITRIFRTLYIQNKTAFVYWVYIPGMPMWIGASPEIFLRKKKQTLHTMALAGTKKDSEEWDEKNLAEHNYVVDYMNNVLNVNGLSNIIKDDVETIKAGNVFHLQTKFSADIVNFDIIPSLVSNIHPTPAVCGFPKEKTQEKISLYESYDRLYYTGFVGPISENTDFSFYVNIRCMSIASKTVKIYVGSGIMKDSTPESEWNETNLKSLAIRRVLGYNLRLRNVRH